MIARPPPRTTPLGIYVHIPFCAVRCSYCDFATVAGRDDRIERYLDALVREIEAARRSPPLEADSLFFGGGTPSRLAPAQVRRLIDAVESSFALAADREITLEGNPESLAPRALDELAAAGVTRISVGVQSLDDEVLARVRRPHDGPAALAALDAARRVEGLVVSADLILGLPGEPLERWDETLARVADRGPDHVSVYLLEIDKEAPLTRAIRAGRVGIEDDDRLAEAWRAGSRRLEALGLERYEVSSFARAGRRSRHNTKYWTDVEYAGFGIGAHAYLDGARRSNTRGLERYLEALEGGLAAVEDEDAFDPARRLEEALMLGLRLREGLDPAAAGARYGVRTDEVLEPIWLRHVEAGLVERAGARVRLTERGTLLGNEVFADVIGLWSEKAAP